MINCGQTGSADRRRSFWTTQPGACGESPLCGDDCGRAGLSYDGNISESRTIRTNDWVRGLVLNILYTDGRKPDTACGFRPGTQGGHWSESFRTDGQKIGTLVRNLPKSSSVRDSVALTRATLIADLNKLILMGVAQTINVTTEYLGGNVMAADIDIIAPDGTTARVGLTGKRNANAWVWK